MFDLSKQPMYIMHMDETDSNTLVQTADGFTLNEVTYLSETKVNELITAKESEIKAWATSQFQAKA